jgi:hypothetical protein
MDDHGWRTAQAKEDIKTPSPPISQAWCPMSVIPAVWEIVGRMIKIQALLGAKCKILSEKIIKVKRAGSIAQKVEHLPSK